MLTASFGKQSEVAEPSASIMNKGVRCGFAESTDSGPYCR